PRHAHPSPTRRSSDLAGCWRAEIVAPDRDEAPAIEVWHQEARLDGVSLAAPSAPGRWPVAVPIPASLLSDGVQTFVVREVATGRSEEHTSELQSRENL